MAVMAQGLTRGSNLRGLLGDPQEVQNWSFVPAPLPGPPGGNRKGPAPPSEGNPPKTEPQEHQFKKPTRGKTPGWQYPFSRKEEKGFALTGRAQKAGFMPQAGNKETEGPPRGRPNPKHETAWAQKKPKNQKSELPKGLHPPSGSPGGSRLRLPRFPMAKRPRVTLHTTGGSRGRLQAHHPPGSLKGTGVRLGPPNSQPCSGHSPRSLSSTGEPNPLRGGVPDPKPRPLGDSRWKTDKGPMGGVPERLGPRAENNEPNPQSENWVLKSQTFKSPWVKGASLTLPPKLGLWAQESPRTPYF
ncbi:basic salivary proline-rich protein 1-like [Penaeus monodon]|uniref:basic salivary proline-rich protein 1-like n=1 Tax=Penaeus monodon TaxID=6687 RepID=UPI0018A7CD21|nr:basic salivary proline-rich protein 1-like [Penaeus monodon]